MSQWCKRYKRSLFFIGLFSFLLWSGCGRPIDMFSQKISELGYIAFLTPAELSGVGTIVGGNPDRLAILAPSESCFPKMSHGVPTDLKQVDPISVFQFDQSFDLKANGQILFDLLRIGTPSINVGANIHEVKKIRLQMSNATVEYFDAVKMIGFYNTQMTDVCKQFLDQVGFIVQALRVENLRFEFYDLNNGQIKLDIQKIKQFINVNTQVDWAIEEGVTLVINTPKYIGYQLARLRFKDRGLSLYRSSEVVNNQFVFRFLGDVDPHAPQFHDAGSLFTPDWERIDSKVEEIFPR